MTRGSSIRREQPPGDRDEGGPAGSVRRRFAKGGLPRDRRLGGDGPKPAGRSGPPTTPSSGVRRGDDSVLCPRKRRSRVVDAGARRANNTPALVRAGRRRGEAKSSGFTDRYRRAVEQRNRDWSGAPTDRRPDSYIGGGQRRRGRRLDGLNRLRQVCLGVDEDLRLLLDRFGGRRPSDQTRARAPGPRKGSGHLARLWARRVVLATKGRGSLKAIALSVDHRLVTAVSGAVVLLCTRGRRAGRPTG